MNCVASWSEGKPSVCINVYPETDDESLFLDRMLEKCGTETLRLVINSNHRYDYVKAHD